MRQLILVLLGSYFKYFFCNFWWSISFSSKATIEFEKTRKIVSSFLNVNSTEEIIFTSGTTHSINMVAFGFLKNNIINIGYRDESIIWDGLDDFGDKLAKGVYVYKILVKSVEGGEKVEKFEKLVILN